MAGIRLYIDPPSGSMYNAPDTLDHDAALHHLFVLAALTEIGGARLIWQGVRAFLAAAGAV